MTEHKTLGMRLNRSQGRNPRTASGIAVSVKRCARCDLVFPDPMPIPAHIADHYGKPPESYWKEAYFQENADYFGSQIETAKKLIHFKPGMTALDIGSGIGKCMVALSRAGFDAYGIEPSAPFRDRAIDHFRLPPERIRLAALEDADFPSSTFDFITFGAVLEHLYSPSGSLEKAFRWLKPGGVIQAEVPSSNWLILKLVNSYYRLRGVNYVTNISPMHPPYHLYEFSLRSFQHNAKRIGYEIAYHHHMVCTIYHVPKILHPLFRWYMERTKTGLQLEVYLRKPVL